MTPRSDDKIRSFAFPGVLALLIMVVGWTLNDKLNDLKKLMEQVPHMQEQINSIEYRVRALEKPSMHSDYHSENLPHPKELLLLKERVLFDRGKSLHYYYKGKKFLYL